MLKCGPRSFLRKNVQFGGQSSFWRSPNPTLPPETLKNKSCALFFGGSPTATPFFGGKLWSIAGAHGLFFPKFTFFGGISLFDQSVLPQNRAFSGFAPEKGPQNTPFRVIWNRFEAKPDLPQTKIWCVLLFWGFFLSRRQIRPLVGSFWAWFCKNRSRLILGRGKSSQRHLTATGHLPPEKTRAHVCAQKVTA